MENVESRGEEMSQTAGSQLRAAREAAGLSRADVAAKTKVAERHLLAIEEDRLGDLAARTYAVGFSRAYARAVGVDEKAIAAQIRTQLENEAPVRVEVAPTFEPGDPARVPSRSLVWVASLGVVVAVGVVLALWGNFFSPEGELPDLIAKKDAPAQVANAPRQAVKPAPQPAPTQGPVVLTATGDKVWLKVTDGKGEQVLQKELAQGETWTAPEGVEGLQLRTGRPDALTISVAGKALPLLSDKPELVSGVSLKAADLIARSTPVVASANPVAVGSGSISTVSN